MAVELVYRLAILVVVRRFLGMGAANSRSLRCDSCVRVQHFVRRTIYIPFRRFWGGVCDDNSCNVFMLLLLLW
jgi:hypothetical protein